MPFGSGVAGIRFYKPCPALLWSADQTESTTFAISRDHPTIDLQALVNTVGGITDDPGFFVGNNAALHDGYTQDPEDTDIRFTVQYRHSGETVWTDVVDEASALTYRRVGVNPLVTGTFHAENAITRDGDWELRLEADCYAAAGAGTGRDAFDKAYTPSLTGTVDWTLPEVVAVTTTSGSTMLTVADMVYAIYSEPIDCSNAYGRLTFGASTSSPVALATAGPQRLRMGCDGPKLWISMIQPSVEELAAGPVTILVSGVTDLAGNLADDAQDEWSYALRNAAESRRKQEVALAKVQQDLADALGDLADADAVEDVVVVYLNRGGRHRRQRKHHVAAPGLVTGAGASVTSARTRRALSGISLLVSERLANEAQLDAWESGAPSNVTSADIDKLQVDIARLLEAERNVDLEQWAQELDAVQSERANLKSRVKALEAKIGDEQRLLAQLKQMETTAGSDSKELANSANAHGSATDTASNSNADDEKNHADLKPLLTACFVFIVAGFAVQVFSVHSNRNAARQNADADPPTAFPNTRFAEAGESQAAVRSADITFNGAYADEQSVTKVEPGTTTSGPPHDGGRRLTKVLDDFERATSVANSPKYSMASASGEELHM
jgi:hypothetical protein